MPSPKKGAKAQSAEREVKYPTPACQIAVGDSALTVEQAKDLLGWEETDDKEKALLTDREGKRIFCANNVNNRPLAMAEVEALVQEILYNRWQFNFENIIVGKTGLICNGQHTLIALALAEQDRLAGTCKVTGKKWTAIHPNPLTIEKSIGYGVEETDEVINTLDTNRPRTLADVIFRSQYFQDFKISGNDGTNRKLTKGERTQIARMCEHAIRLVWSRTGVENAFGLKRTHAESLAFLDRHKRIVDCVKHVYVENMDGKVGDIIGPGYASGLMYLFASSASDGAKYYKADPRSEKKMDFSRMDKAEEFFVFLAAGDPQFKALREAVAMLKNEAEGTTGTMSEKMELIIKAWNLFISGTGFTEKRLALSYETKDDGTRKLASPGEIVGGIDAGQPEEEPEPEDDPAEIEANKETVKKEAIAKKADPKPPVAPPAPKKSAKQILDEKREAEARAADAAKEPPLVAEIVPAPTPAAPANGFKPAPKPKPRPIPVQPLRGGI